MHEVRPSDGGKVSASKSKGTKWETAVKEWLNRRGWRGVARHPQHGARDVGDLSGIPQLVIQCKNERTYTWGPYLRELQEQIRNADASAGVLVVHRMNQASVEEALFVMDAESFACMLQATYWGDHEEPG